MSEYSYEYVDENENDNSSQRSRFSQELDPVVQALNSLGSIGKAMVAIFAYRSEIKRLNLERERIHGAAKNINERTKAILTLEMEKITAQREAITVSFNYAEKLLRERRVTRESLNEALREATALMPVLYRKEPLPSPEVLTIHRDLITSLTASLRELETASSNEMLALNSEFRKTIQEIRADLHNNQPFKFLE